MLQSHRRPNLSVDTNEARPDASVPFSQRQAQGRHRHFHTSVFRSSQLEVQVHSPSIKATHRNSYEPSKTLPVFGDHDAVEGAVLLEPHLAVSPGRLTVTFEGAFIYLSPVLVDAHDPNGVPVGGSSDKYRHLFFSSTASFTTGETSSPRSASSLRDAFTNSVRSRKVEHKSGASELTVTTRPHFPFSFEIPRPGRHGEELPPTCSNIMSNTVGIRGRSSVERAEVEYKIITIWESATEVDERTRLEAPILFQPDTDFQSLDGLYLEPESWLEIPLRSDRIIPFKCAVTLPDPPTFPRSASIPFFVVFTTYPRSSTLAREIAADATIAVSLLRQVTVLSRPSPLYSPTISTSSSSDDSDTSVAPKRTLLRRVTKSKSHTSMKAAADAHRRRHPKDKPLPPIPHGISDTRSLQTDVCVGFPKRPRNRPASHERHPSIEAANALPDGLYKGKLKLEKNMLPSIDWAGLSVKYFVEVSVLFGQDELRARVPVRIF